MTEPDRIWINEKWEAYLRPTFDGDTSGYIRADLSRAPLAEALVDLMPEVLASLDATGCNVSLVADIRAALRAIGERAE